MNHEQDRSGGNHNGSPGISRRMAAIAAAVAVGAGSLLGVQAMADSNTYRHLKLAAGDGGWHHGWHRRGGFSDLDDAEIEDRIERMIKHAAIEIDASEEQETRLIELVTGAARELRPLRDDMRQTREALHGLLMADPIDREALEALRMQRLAQIEQVSKNLVNTLADVAEVLTPEQREMLDERIREFRSRHGKRRRG